VGADPNELYGNRYEVTNKSGTGPAQPPGGTCCAASSSPSDTVATVGQNPPTFQFTTLVQSATPGDRILTFEYSLNGQGVSQQMNVTARQFAFVTNNSPSNTCTLGHGTIRSYVYKVFTRPDETAILSTDALSNTAVTETFSAPHPPAKPRQQTPLLTRTRNLSTTLVPAPARP